MKDVKVKLYSFKELSKEVQEEILDLYLDSDISYAIFNSSIESDMIELAEKMGIVNEINFDNIYLEIDNPNDIDRCYYEGGGFEDFCERLLEQSIKKIEYLFDRDIQKNNFMKNSSEKYLKNGRVFLSH